MYYVYRFVDEFESVIYVGKSKQNLRQRFLSHIHLPKECYSLVRKVEYIECATEADMSIKEIFYINKYSNNPIYFNLLDVTEVPLSVDFSDEWKIYMEELPPIFNNSINVINEDTKVKELGIDTLDILHRTPNHNKGKELFVDALTKDEVQLIVEYFIDQTNKAVTGHQEQLCFRNLIALVLGVNLPLKANLLLKLKYKDLFDENDCLKPIEYKLQRLQKDAVIQIPLRNSVKKVLLAYCKTYGLTYVNNAEDNIFQSRKNQLGSRKNPTISMNALWRIISRAAEAVGVKKNIGAESLRKTYGLNIFVNCTDKLSALCFLGDMWGRVREANIVKYLNLIEEDIDYEYFFGDEFSLADVDLSKIDCLEDSNRESVKNNEKNIKF